MAPITNTESELARIFEATALCKADKTCPRLTVRGNFFEPNPETVEAWRRRGIYGQGVDRRVMFVCESPSSTYDGSAPDFRVQGIGGYRTWAGRNRRTIPFFDIRKRYGFENCLITNSVKCGCPGPVTNKPSNEEIERCSVILQSEIQAVRPGVVACLGGNAFKYATPALAKLTITPTPAQILVTHYSAWKSPEALKKEWTAQFEEIKRELERRGMSPETPVYS